MGLKTLAESEVIFLFIQVGLFFIYLSSQLIFIGFQLWKQTKISRIGHKKAREDSKEGKQFYIWSLFYTVDSFLLISSNKYQYIKSQLLKSQQLKSQDPTQIF